MYVWYVFTYENVFLHKYDMYKDVEQIIELCVGTCTHIQYYISIYVKW